MRSFGLHKFNFNQFLQGFDKEIVSDIDDEEVPQIDFGYDKNGDPQQLESPALQVN